MLIPNSIKKYFLDNLDGHIEIQVKLGRFQYSKKTNSLAKHQFASPTQILCNPKLQFEEKVSQVSKALNDAPDIQAVYLAKYKKKQSPRVIAFIRNPFY